LAITNRTWLRGSGPLIVVGVCAVVVVGAWVVGTVVGAIVVAGVSVVLVTAAVDVADAVVDGAESDVDVVDSDVDGVDAVSPTVTAESSTKSSLGCGRPAMATPATAPTATTARTNGQDLRMRPAKLPAGHVTGRTR